MTDDLKPYGFIEVEHYPRGSKITWSTCYAWGDFSQHKSPFLIEVEAEVERQAAVMRRAMRAQIDG